jgi:hypothetical protein
MQPRCVRSCSGGHLAAGFGAFAAHVGALRHFPVASCHALAILGARLADLGALRSEPGFLAGDAAAPDGFADCYSIIMENVAYILIIDDHREIRDLLP